jgi:hypothetical protein
MDMAIKHNGTQTASKESAEYFTGTVRIDPLFNLPEPARSTGASVTFVEKLKDIGVDRMKKLRVEQSVAKTNAFGGKE